MGPIRAPFVRSNTSEKVSECMWWWWWGLSGDREGSLLLGVPAASDLSDLTLLERCRPWGPGDGQGEGEGCAEADRAAKASRCCCKMRAPTPDRARAC